MNHHPTNDNDYDYDNNYDDNYDDENGFAIAELGNNDTDTDRYTNKKKKNSNQSTIDVYTSTNTNTNMDTNDTTANANTNTNTNTITITNTNITNTITNTVRTTNSNADWSGDRKNSIKMAMAQKKEEDRYPVSEDVYAFLFVAPVFSGSFLFSLYVVAVKYTVYSILWKGVHPANAYKPENENDIDIDEYKAATAAKFFLIPVAIAMQEDLINCYFFFANVIYCESSALAISATATQRKLFFSYTLRLIDGLLSLAINVGVMLSTYATLAVFLNFAALSFLQSIDDVFYELVVKGFFGDKMEHMSTICNKITFKRRAGDDNFKICGFLKVGHLDTILFFGTCLVCLALYFWFTSVQHVRFRTLGTGGGNNSTNEQD